MDFLSYQARAWDEREHVLTHKEAMILKVFAEREGAILPREELLDEVWGHEVYPSTRTIDNFIVRLRKRFERNPEAPEHFHTVRGVRLPVHPGTGDRAWLRRRCWCGRFAARRRRAGRSG